MFKRITFLLTLFLKSIKASISYSSKNYYGQHSEPFCYDRHLLESTWTWVQDMTTMIGCAVVISVSTSCSRSDILTQSSFSPLSRSLTVDFILFSLFIFILLFISFFFFIFLFLEQLGLGFISHAVTSVTN